MVLCLDRIPLPANPILPENNVCCLDYSVARKGTLVSYRWDGEANLTVAKSEWAPAGVN